MSKRIFLILCAATLLVSSGAIADCFPSKKACALALGAQCTWESGYGYYFRFDGRSYGYYSTEMACLDENLLVRGRSCVWESGYGYCAH